MTPGSDTSATEGSGPMRLQRYLARCGVASRRKSEQLIEQGRVQVNGEVTTVLGTRVDPAADEIQVDGDIVRLPQNYSYVLMNKPSGYVTTMDDPQGRPTVAELLPADDALFPVGRLDMDTTGVLLFTSDGELAHRLMHPSYHAEKVYLARVRGTVSQDAVDRLASGVDLEDGLTRNAQVEVLECRQHHTQVRITLREGRNRQVKRMFDAVGHRVVALHREAFGPLSLGTLQEGRIRDLSSEEVKALRETVQMEA